MIAVLKEILVRLSIVESQSVREVEAHGEVSNGDFGSVDMGGSKQFDMEQQISSAKEASSESSITTIILCKFITASESSVTTIILCVCVCV